jgi:hypothetical protein
MSRELLIAVVVALVVALATAPVFDHPPSNGAVPGTSATAPPEQHPQGLPVAIRPETCGAAFAVCAVSVTPDSIDSNGIATSGIALATAWVGGDNSWDRFTWSGAPWKFSLCPGPQTTWVFTCEIDVPGVYVFNLTATAPGGAVAWGEAAVYVSTPPTVRLGFAVTTPNPAVGDPLTAIATVSNGSAPFTFTFQASPACGGSTVTTFTAANRVGTFTCVLATSGVETISVTLTDSPGYQTLAPPYPSDQQSVDVSAAPTQGSTVPPSQSVGLLEALSGGLVVGVAVGAASTWALVNRKS